ncbi:MAG: transglycosylase SLT domain-containing protein [Deltaproteobacteria bacterium]|nr:transglycosylase SLT domain-containing protein [Deltaproteobacteria bacterium]
MHSGTTQRKKQNKGGLKGIFLFGLVFFPSASNPLLSGLVDRNYFLIYDTIQNLGKQVEEGTLPHPVYFLMGATAYNEERYDDALEHLKRAEVEGSPLAAHIRYWIGKTLNALNRPAEAIAYLPPIDKIERKIEEDIFWERMESLILLSRWEEAETGLNRRKKEAAKDEPVRTRIKYLRGQMASLQGKKAIAHRTWKELLTESAGNPFEEEIIDQLKKENTPLSDFLSEADWKKRAQSLIEAGRPLDALAIYDDLYKTTGRNFSFEIAKTHFKARHYSKSASLLQELMDHPKGGQNRTEILSLLAASYGRSDQFEEALKYNQKIIDLYPRSNMARMARYKIAFIHLDAGQYSRAVEAFTEYLSTKNDYRRAEAVWNRLWAVYLTGNFSGALDELKNLEKKERKKDELLKIAYWKARCLEQMNKGSAARLIYEDIHRRKPTHYYGFLSAQKMAGKKIDPMELVDPTNTPSPLPLPLEGGGIKGGGAYKADNWREKIPPDDPLMTAVQLAEIGLSEYAFDEAERSSLSREGIPLDSLSQALTAAQNFRQLCAIGRAGLKKISAGRDNGLYWTMAYPRAYFQWTTLFSKKQALNSLLVWAMMREESSFHPAIVSSAQAIGLLQLIPQTGKEVALLLGRDVFHPEDLKAPATNIEFGVTYLKKRLDEFGGKVPYALAGYNAGPDAVHRWEKWGAKLEPDEFIELIPYDETRGYVKKVMTSYWIYKTLY